MRKTAKRNNKSPTKTREIRKKTLKSKNSASIKGKTGNFKQ